LLGLPVFSITRISSFMCQGIYYKRFLQHHKVGQYPGR
jgi:hypothetical protein